MRGYKGNTVMDVVLHLAPSNLREVLSLYHLILSLTRAMVRGCRPSLEGARVAEWIWKLLSMSGAPEVDESLLYDCAQGILPAQISESWSRGTVLLVQVFKWLNLF